MQRNASQPLLSPAPYSKTKKPFLHPPSPHFFRSPPSLLAVSLICLSVGLASTIFALYSLSSRPKLPFPIRCARVLDTFRPRYSASGKLGRSEVGAGSATDRLKLLGFVGVQTGFSSADRRQALRDTWFPSLPDDLLRLEQATGLAFRFVIGRSKDRKRMAELEQEIEKHQDFLLINIEEDNAKAPYKTLEFFKAALELFEADYYVKADDDIYLRPGCESDFGELYNLLFVPYSSTYYSQRNCYCFCLFPPLVSFVFRFWLLCILPFSFSPDRLATLLAKERSNSMTYIGCMKKGPVITDPKMKWYEGQGYLIGSEYFLHANGPIYILSAEVVASLAAAKNNSLRMFSNEDVTIGSWMLSMNVDHEDISAMCDPRCTPKSIAVWDVPKCAGLCNPATRLKELHEISMCSKSPTLPPDDEER